MQYLAIQWIQSYPWKTKTSQDTATKSTKACRSRRISKGFYTPTVHRNAEKLVKIFSGTILRPLLIGCKQMELQREQWEESKKALNLFSCNPDSMNSGRQNLVNVVATCAMSRIFCQMGKLHMNGALKWADHTVRIESRISSVVSERSLSGRRC